MALAVYIHHTSRNTLLQGSDRFSLRLQATVGLETFGQNVTVRNATFINNMYEPTTMIRVRGGSCQLANVLLVNYLPFGTALVVVEPRGRVVFHDRQRNTWLLRSR